MTKETSQPQMDREIFPEYMNLIGDVFSFQFPDIRVIKKTFSTSVEMVNALEKLFEFIVGSDLDDDVKNMVLQLIDQEREVIMFSEISRNSIVQL